ncbi:trypsin-like peptidase domain-containing protein [Pyxidicoccus parkwayensis]|jgi:serine protease DegQ|uniref:Trypsin-like peptidase domain-containing protein n=1 Tax=Pyxidicoccus parkwayensis TaxID=2813578 RepID=A0ABX7NQD4_9BACT|nr:trypsin-like peptidase domain-containing protein [Pyxidicoccus parkwaysis]QSQ21075.1 trypsin-like peptidase domain-containing protein [Pyxidicoccus parkwaysis]
MSTDLQSLSQSLASIVERVAPSIVRVEARRRRGASGIVWSTEGHILTTSHAVEHEGHIQVGLSDGRTVSAELIGRDPSTDLALLKVDASNLTPIPAAPLDDVKVGHLAVTIARPGRTARATLGMVSTHGEGWRTHAGGKVDRYLETDADLPPGFSGGALVDTQGRIIGLLTAAFSRTAAVVIPNDTLTRVASTLKEHGGVRRGYLGVGAYPVRIPQHLVERAGTEAGLVFLSVDPDGPAHKAGMLLGDVLVSLGGQSLHRVEDLLGYLGDEKVGTTVQARVLRAGELREVPITIGKRA